MADITIGQYYPENSIIHKLDPRIKLFGTMVYIVSLFIANNVLGYVLETIALVAVIKMSKVPPKKILKGLKGIIFILIFGAIFNLFFTKDGKTVVDFWVIEITTGGIVKTVYIMLRLIYLVLGTSIMTLTTKPADLADGLEKSFGFLKKVRFPVHEMAMMMSLALRFIPILMEETDKIMKAQKARGADFESGNFIQRIKNYLPLLIPLFVSAMSRALELATAMEARCYNGGNRTKMKPLKYGKNDIISYFVFAVFFLLIIATDVLVINVKALSVLQL